MTAGQCLAQDPNSIVPLPGQSDICVDSNTLAFINDFYKVPTSLLGPSDNTGTFTFVGAQTVTDNYGTERVDFHLSDRDSINSSYYYDKSIWSVPAALDNTFQGYIVSRWALSAEENHVFSSALVNSLRFGYNDSGVTNPSLVALNPQMLNHAFGETASLLSPSIAAVTGGSGVPGLTSFQSWQPKGGEDSATHMYEVFDDAVYTVGRHSFKFGADYLRDAADFVLTGQVNGTVSFASVSNFLQNIPGISQGPTGGGFVKGITPHEMVTNVVGGYFQDDWKVRPRLTVNLGMRYEFETIPAEVNGKMANLPFLTTNPGGCVANADGTPNRATCSALNPVMFTRNPTKRNFDPRIGFAWDPFGDGKTSVRGGFGIFDVLPLPFMLDLNNGQTAPFQAKALITPAPNSFPTGIGTELSAGGGAPLPPNQVSWNYVQPAPKRNYVMQWNFNAQRQLTPNTWLTLAYAGARGLHKPFQTDELNTVFPFQTPGIGGGYLYPTVVNTLGQQVACSGPSLPAGACGTSVAYPTGIVPGNLINPNVGEIQSTAWWSQSWYNSMQVVLQKRMSLGFQVQGSFTWSRSEDTSSGSLAGDNFGSDITPTIPWFDQRIIKGLSDFNVGKNLVINGLWNIPTPASITGPAALFVKGWGVGAILTLSDGIPVWPLDGVSGGDPMGQLNSEPMAIPSLAPGCTTKNLVSKGNVQYLNPSCFINAQAPSLAFYNQAAPMGCDHSIAFPTCINLLGTLGRNEIIGPGEANVDASIVKDTHITKISEAFDVQFRAEFFNITNRVNFQAPIDNLSPIDGSGNPIPGFGQIDAQQIPSREIQFALKVIW